MDPCLFTKISAQDIRMKLVTTLLSNDNVSLDAVLEGLNATENQIVSTEIKRILSGTVKKADDIGNDGSGDSMGEMSTYATSLVDEVIALAEEKTAAQFQIQPPEEDEVEVTMEDEPPVTIIHKTVNDVTSTPEKSEDVDQQVDENKLVEADVQVHKIDESEETDEQMPEEATVDTATQDEDPVKEEEPRKSPLIIPDTNDAMVDETTEEVAVTEVDHKADLNGFAEPAEKEVPPPTSSISQAEPECITEAEEKLEDVQVEAQTEDLDSEDIDNIDIEKEFIMPPEAQIDIPVNGTQHIEEEAPPAKSTSPIARPVLTRMASNDVIINGKEKSPENNNVSANANNNNSTDSELDAILARKALVRQQVERFEKQPPTTENNAKFSIRASASPTKMDQPDGKGEDKGTNVKNLKNFFQQLSNSGNKTTSPSGI